MTQTVATLGVGELVAEHRTPTLFRPGGRTRRKENGRPEQTPSHGHDVTPAPEDPESATEVQRAREVVEQG